MNYYRRPEITLFAEVKCGNYRCANSEQLPVTISARIETGGSVELYVDVKDPLPSYSTFKLTSVDGSSVKSYYCKACRGEK